jgi:hypothetical protein
VEANGRDDTAATVSGGLEPDPATGADEAGDVDVVGVGSSGTPGASAALMTRVGVAAAEPTRLEATINRNVPTVLAVRVPTLRATHAAALEREEGDAVPPSRLYHGV